MGLNGLLSSAENKSVCVVHLLSECLLAQGFLAVTGVSGAAVPLLPIGICSQEERRKTRKMKVVFFFLNLFVSSFLFSFVLTFMKREFLADEKPQWVSLRICGSSAFVAVLSSSGTWIILPVSPPLL